MADDFPGNRRSISPAGCGRRGLTSGAFTMTAAIDEVNGKPDCNGTSNSCPR
jgi:hypothetical protein